MSFAGTARTEVAVGTWSEASMFCTILPATPRRTVVLAPAGADWTCGFGAALTGSAFCAGVGGVTDLGAATVAAAGASVPALAALLVAFAAVASSGVTI